VGPDQIKALEAISRELREHGDQYRNAPDLDTALHRLAERTGVKVDWPQLESLLRTLGLSKDLKPSDKDGVQAALTRATRKAPAESLSQLMRCIKP
jgi:hypothetical protein